MGEKINSSKHELCPIVSPDGKFLFFISLRGESKSVYWVNAKIIENLKPNELK
jgi:Tol biopolymer transport system component